MAIEEKRGNGWKSSSGRKIPNPQRVEKHEVLIFSWPWMLIWRHSGDVKLSRDFIYYHCSEKNSVSVVREKEASLLCGWLVTVRSSDFPPNYHNMGVTSQKAVLLSNTISGKRSRPCSMEEAFPLLCMSGHWEDGPVHILLQKVAESKLGWDAEDDPEDSESWFVSSQLYFEFSMTSLISTSVCIRTALSRYRVSKRYLVRILPSSLVIPNQVSVVWSLVYHRIIQRYGPIARPSK